MSLIIKNLNFKVCSNYKILYIKHTKCYLQNNKLFLVNSIFTKSIIFSKANLARYNLWGVKKKQTKRLFNHSLHFKIKYKK
jgi:hypothetical protein